MKKKHTRLLRESAETLVLTLVVFAFLVTFVVQGFKVFGNCMEPNLQTGERLLGNKFVYHFGKPARGDIVVFKYPPDPNEIYIKRVVGLPGEKLAINEGKVYINDRLIDEQDYVMLDSNAELEPRVIQPDCVFVLGDNRDHSNDSRFWGELPVRNIQARAWIRYWPPSRFEVF